MNRRPFPNVSKPYFRLPIGPAGPRSDAPARHDRFRGWTGRLELTIEVQSDYLHAGSGLLELTDNGRAYAAFSRRGEALVLSASGLKGAVRSVVEAISNSCVSQHARDEHPPGSHGPCRGVRPGQEADARLCPACRIFGVTGYRGRVHFADAVAEAGTRPQIIKIGDLWSPRLATGRKFYHVKTFQRLDDRPQPNHRYVEAVPKGSRFRTRLAFENADAAELGLVARALGLDRSAERADGVVFALSPKLGGARPRCLGAVRFRPERLVILPESAAGLLAALAAGGEERRPFMPTIRAWLNADDLLDADAWAHYCAAMQPTEEPCPQGLY